MNLSVVWGADSVRRPTRPMEIERLRNNEYFRSAWVNDRGSAVLETALMLPVIVAVLVVCLWFVSLGMTHVRAGEAARAAARVAARGGADAEVIAEAHRSLAGATVKIEPAGDHIDVVVDDFVGVRLPIFGQIGVNVEAKAVAANEAAVTQVP